MTKSDKSKKKPFILGRMSDGAANAVTDGPFGWITDQLRSGRQYPAKSGHKWAGIFSADEESGDAPEGPGNTPTAAKSQKGRGA